MGNAHARAAPSSPAVPGGASDAASQGATLRRELEQLDVAYVAECYERAVRALAPRADDLSMPQPTVDRGTEVTTLSTHLPLHRSSDGFDEHTPVTKPRGARSISEFHWSRGVTRSGTRYTASGVDAPISSALASDGRSAPAIAHEAGNGTQFAMALRDTKQVGPTGSHRALDSMITRSQFSDIFTITRFIQPAAAASPSSSKTPLPSVDVPRLATLRLSFDVFDAFAVLRIPKPIRNEVHVAPVLAAGALSPAPSAKKASVALYRLPSSRSIHSSSQKGTETGRSQSNSARTSPRRSPTSSHTSSTSTGALTRMQLQENGHRGLSPLRRAHSMSNIDKEAEPIMLGEAAMLSGRAGGKSAGIPNHSQSAVFDVSRTHSARRIIPTNVTTGAEVATEESNAPRVRQVASRFSQPHASDTRNASERQCTTARQGTQPSSVAHGPTLRRMHSAPALTLTAGDHGTDAQPAQLETAEAGTVVAPLASAAPAHGNLTAQQLPCGNRSAGMSSARATTASPRTDTDLSSSRPATTQSAERNPPVELSTPPPTAAVFEYTVAETMAAVADAGTGALEDATTSARSALPQAHDGACGAVLQRACNNLLGRPQTSPERRRSHGLMLASRSRAARPSTQQAPKACRPTLEITTPIQLNHAASLKQTEPPQLAPLPDATSAADQLDLAVDMTAATSQVAGVHDHDDVGEWLHGNRGTDGHGSSERPRAELDDACVERCTATAAVHPGATRGMKRPHSSSALPGRITPRTETSRRTMSAQQHRRWVVSSAGQDDVHADELPTDNVPGEEGHAGLGPSCAEPDSRGDIVPVLAGNGPGLEDARRAHSRESVCAQDAGEVGDASVGAELAVCVPKSAASEPEVRTDKPDVASALDVVVQADGQRTDVSMCMLHSGTSQAGVNPTDATLDIHVQSHAPCTGARDTDATRAAAPDMVVVAPNAAMETTAAAQRQLVADIVPPCEIPTPGVNVPLRPASPTPDGAPVACKTDADSSSDKVAATPEDVPARAASSASETGMPDRVLTRRPSVGAAQDDNPSQRTQTFDVPVAVDSAVNMRDLITGMRAAGHVPLATTQADEITEDKAVGTSACAASVSGRRSATGAASLSATVVASKLRRRSIDKRRTSEEHAIVRPRLAGDAPSRAELNGAANNARRASRTSLGNGDRRPSIAGSSATQPSAYSGRRRNSGVPTAVTAAPEDTDPDPAAEQAAQEALDDDLLSLERAVLLKAGANVDQDYAMLAGAASTPRSKFKRIAALSCGMAAPAVPAKGEPHCAKTGPVRTSIALAHKSAVHPTEDGAVHTVITFDWSPYQTVLLYHRLHTEDTGIVQPPARPLARQAKAAALQHSRESLSTVGGNAAQLLDAAGVAAMLLEANDPKVLDDAMRRATSVASASEVFTLLAMYARGALEDKALVLYRVFSQPVGTQSYPDAATRGHNALTGSGLRALVCNALSIWYTIGELSLPPTNALVEAFMEDARNCAADWVVAPSSRDDAPQWAPRDRGAAVVVDHAKSDVQEAAAAAADLTGSSPSRPTVRRLSIRTDASSARGPETHAAPVVSNSRASLSVRALREREATIVVPAPAFVAWLRSLVHADHTERVIGAFVSLCAELQHAVSVSGGKDPVHSVRAGRAAPHQTEPPQAAAGNSSDRGKTTARRSGQHLFAMATFGASGGMELNAATCQLLQTQVAQLLLAVYLHSDYAGACGLARALTSISGMRTSGNKARQQLLQSRRDPRVATKIGPVSTGPPAGSTSVHSADAAAITGHLVGARRGSTSNAAAAAALLAAHTFTQLSASGAAHAIAAASGLSLDALWFKLVIAAESPWQVGKQNILPAATQQYIALTPFSAALHHSRLVLQAVAAGKPIMPMPRMTARGHVLSPLGPAPVDGVPAVSQAKKPSKDSGTAADLFGDLSLRSPRKGMLKPVVMGSERLAVSPSSRQPPRLAHLNTSMSSPEVRASASSSSLGSAETGGADAAGEPRRRRRSSFLETNLAKMEGDFLAVAANLQLACTLMEHAEMTAEGIDTRDPQRVAERRELLRRKFRRTMQRAAAVGKAVDGLKSAPLAKHHANVRELGSVVSSVMASPRAATSARKPLAPAERQTQLGSGSPARGFMPHAASATRESVAAASAHVASMESLIARSGKRRLHPLLRQGPASSTPALHSAADFGSGSTTTTPGASSSAIAASSPAASASTLPSSLRSAGRSGAASGEDLLPPPRRFVSPTPPMWAAFDAASPLPPVRPRHGHGRAHHPSRDASPGSGTGKGSPGSHPTGSVSPLKSASRSSLGAMPSMGPMRQHLLSAQELSPFAALTLPEGSDREI